LSIPHASLQTSNGFAADEPILGSHPLVTDAQVPQFGNTEEWNLNGVIRRPARLHAAAWTLVFSHELTQAAVESAGA
jgi:hypothetical protein